MTHPIEIITKTVFLRLSSILNEQADTNLVALLLEDKLSVATIVEPAEAPHDLVTMNSKFVGKISDDKMQPNRGPQIMTLVYPREANIIDGRISILTPLGAGLLGSRAGETIKWDGVDGITRQLLIDKVIYQPEASGDWNL